MMAVGQARLARRANIREPGIPNYPSPSNLNITKVSHNSSPYIVNTYNHYSEENLVISTPTKCSICLENISNENKKKLSCNHEFHKDCIITWLRQQNTCPNCRQEQTNDNLQESIESDNRQNLTNITIPNTTRYIYNRLSNRDYFVRRDRRTVVFPSSWNA